MPSAESLNRLTSIVVQAAIRIHRALGPGLLEGAYLQCVCFELAEAGVMFEAQSPLPLIYKGVKIDCAYRADIIVERAVIVEVKAVEAADSRAAALHISSVGELSCGIDPELRCRNHEGGD